MIGIEMAFFYLSMACKSCAGSKLALNDMMRSKILALTPIGIFAAVGWLSHKAKDKTHRILRLCLHLRQIKLPAKPAFYSIPTC